MRQSRLRERFALTRNYTRFALAALGVLTLVPDANAGKQKPPLEHAGAQSQDVGSYCAFRVSRPGIDRLRTAPAVDPATCVDLTPTVGLVLFRTLPEDLRAELEESEVTARSGTRQPLTYEAVDISDFMITGSAATPIGVNKTVLRSSARRQPGEGPVLSEASTGVEMKWPIGSLGPRTYRPSDHLLLYIPPMDENGERRILLAGDPQCNPDPCPSQVECGRPTEEKCPPPDPDACSSEIVLPGGDTIPLSRRSLMMKLTDDFEPASRSYRGVIIAADEIELTGHVRTNGTDLLLLAERVIAHQGAMVDVTPLRPSITGTAGRVATLVLLANSIEAPDGLRLEANGAPGALPTTLHNGHGIHPDCEPEGTDIHGNPECFPCTKAAGQCDATGYGTMLGNLYGPDEMRCVTHTNQWIENGVAHLQYVADYPPKPAELPPSFPIAAPSGGDGGPPGRIVWGRGQASGKLELHRQGGRGAQGLESYRVKRRGGNPVCPIEAKDCRRWAEGGSGVAVWTTLEGDTGVTPAGETMVIPAGLAPQVDARDIARLIAFSTGYFVPVESALHRAAAAYRSGLTEEAETHYTEALWLLGRRENDYFCLAPQYDSLRAEALGRLAQLDAGFDYNGRTPAAAPYTPPDTLEPIVLSKLQHATSLAIDIKLNALLSMTSAQQQAAIANGLNQADGELAALELERNALLLKQKQTRAEELLTYVALAEEQLPVLQNQLMTYWQNLADPPAGHFDAVMNLAGKVFGFVGKVKALVGAAGAAFTAYGDYFSLAGAFAEAVSSGAEAYKAFEGVSDLLEQRPECSQDAQCQSLVRLVKRAQLELYAARRALLAGQYAVQAEEANARLFEARRDASRAVVRTLQNNKYEVRDFARLARAGQVLCRYGQLLIDDAAADLFDLKRSAALWDVPVPAADIASYDGTGATYDYDFNQLLDEDCSLANDCTLWGEYNQFLSARQSQVVPGSTILYLGTATDGLGQSLAALLSHTTELVVTDESGVMVDTRRRAELEFGLFAGQHGLGFGARPTNLAMTQGNPDAILLLNPVDVSSYGAIQVHGIAVTGTTQTGQPLRSDFPFRISRPSTERYRNWLTPPSELQLVVSIPQGRPLDSGNLMDQLLYDVATGRFLHETCCDLMSNPIARPESLRKPWTLWVPVCANGNPPSQICATEEELDQLGTLQLELEVRFRVGV